MSPAPTGAEEDGVAAPSSSRSGERDLSPLQKAIRESVNDVAGRLDINPDIVTALLREWLDEMDRQVLAGTRYRPGIYYREDFEGRTVTARMLIDSLTELGTVMETPLESLTVHLGSDGQQVQAIEGWPHPSPVAVMLGGGEQR